MRVLQRDPRNPILVPVVEHAWESLAAFNPCVVDDAGGRCRMLYRAEGTHAGADGRDRVRSVIGCAEGVDGVHFGNRRLLLAPQAEWDRYGCEDPRVVRFEDRWFIFYTALSTYPFTADGIRVALALTRDFEHFERHPVTPFNAKAMALFPDRINGRIAAVLTVDTDRPPAKIALACFDREEDIWSPEFWNDWYSTLDEHVVPLMRAPDDQVEVGAPPLRVAEGWLLVYSRIAGYRAGEPRFGVEAALLAADDPRRVIARTATPLLVPETPVERRGRVENVVFPSGARIEGDDLVVYYGAADTVGCLGRAPLAHVLALLRPPAPAFVPSRRVIQGFDRFVGNPVLRPRPEFAWESVAVCNPGAILIGGRVHLVYRAISADGTSTFGYASSPDGVVFDQREPRPIYLPRAPFEQKQRPGNSGCEDPRLTLLDGRVYVVYTAFDGYTPRIAYSSLSAEDFLARRWNWLPPVVMTPPGVDDKDGCLLPRLVRGRYVVFHRFGDQIRVNSFDDLDFGDGHWVDDRSAMIAPRKEYWDNRKFGIAAPPIETPYGWLLFFHRVTRPLTVYKVEAMLLDLEQPSRVVAETGATLLEPETPEEREGLVPNVVFPCGAVVLDDLVYLYYGGADHVVCAARMPLTAIYRRLGI